VDSLSGEAALPNEVSICCADPDDLIERVCQVVRGKPGAGRLEAAQRTLLAHHIASLEGSLSCERILDSLDDHRALLQEGRSSEASRWKGMIKLYRRNALRAVRSRIRGNKSSREYTAHKFPGISVAEVNRRIARFRGVRPELPAVEARQISTDIFAIERV
jgi:hypothetical protein